MPFSDSLTPLSGPSPVGWFMTPFICDGSLLWDRMIIQDLANFSKIRSPAMCAARIGQAFPDTRTAVPIDTEIIRREPDVTFNSRVFSDGVGTMFYSVMHKIWDRFPRLVCLSPRYSKNSISRYEFPWTMYLVPLLTLLQEPKV